MNLMFLLVALLSSALPLHADERITSFISTLHINTDATVTVQEDITVLSEQKNIVHGIVREFPTIYKSGNLTSTVDFKVQKVTHNGVRSVYSIKDASNGKLIFIGNPDRKIRPGTHTYTVTYTINRHIGFFATHDELYWNVTGNGWRLPIDKAVAHVYTPAGITQQDIAASAYTGYQGAQDTNYTYNITGNQVTFETNKALKKYQGLTIVVTFPKGFVHAPSQMQKLLWLLQDNMLIILLLLSLFLLLCILGVTALRKRALNSTGTVIPLFYPPKGMTPSQVGIMNNMQYKKNFLAADIVDLAVAGYITISSDEKTAWYSSTTTYATSYTLTLKDTVGTQKRDLTKYQQELLDTLFKEQKTLVLTFKHNPILNAADKLCDTHANHLTNMYITLLKKEGLLTVGIAWIAATTSAYLFFDTHTMFESMMTGCGFLLIPIIFFRNFFYVYTPAGRKIQDAIDGFKLYLTTAEVDRMHTIGTPPTRTPELYEQYLPYAMALNVEKQWSAQFASLFKELEKKGGYTPLWYHGSRFNTHTFSSGLSTSLTTVITSASTPPGGRSGSGGRGSSGGGGGGGGGGGW